MRRHPKIKLLDIVVGALVLSALLYFLYRIRIGLHYRWNWGAIPQYLFRYDPDKMRWVPNILIEGLLTTIRLSLWATFLATLIGGTMGLLRVSKSLFARLVGSVYVQSIRNVPPLVLLFIFYYFIGDQILSVVQFDTFLNTAGDTAREICRIFFAPPPLIPAFFSALIALSIFEGSYITEMVRAGIQSIHFGQWEASRALGFNRRQQLYHIILPQAIRRILPPLAGQLISTIKDSAIVSVVSIQELTFQGLELMSATYLTFEIWITITAMYVVLTLSFSMAVSRMEGRMNKAI